MHVGNFAGVFRPRGSYRPQTRKRALPLLAPPCKFPDNTTLVQVRPDTSLPHAPDAIDRSRRDVRAMGGPMSARYLQRESSAAVSGVPGNRGVCTVGAGLGEEGDLLTPEPRRAAVSTQNI